MEQKKENNSNQPDMKEKAYDRALEAYRFHVGRYNTWMNYYALITGAVFVGYYSMEGSASDCGNTFIQIVIVSVGLISSICWHLSFEGYYSWLISWNNVLHFHEREAVDGNKKRHLHTKLHQIYSITNRYIMAKQIIWRGKWFVW